MKYFCGLILFFLNAFCANAGFAQNKDVLYSPTQLKQDLAYLRHLITAVHVNPYSELTEQQYNKLFNQVNESLKDSTTATEFLKQIKPLIAYLSDEHAQINLKPALLATAYRSQAIYPPFSLGLAGKVYSINNCLQDSSLKGLAIKSINGVDIGTLVKKCASATTGFPAQRTDNALRTFGYLYPWVGNTTSTKFIIETVAGKRLLLPGITLKEWENYIANQSGLSACEERLSYRKIGNTGYINACSFDLKPKGKYSFDSIRVKIDDVFKQIKADGVTRLVIDVSRNEGGNSLVGDYLISNIYNKPYKGYQTDWKRSDEYLQLLKSWGIEKPAYAAEPVGKVIHFSSELVVPAKVPYPFTGQTFVLIGRATFSSAMNFATLVKDNNIATLVGQIPVNGHPTGFGEMFYTNLPNTQVFVRFGVKEYIRPVGKTTNNNLTPAKILTDAQMNNIDNAVQQLK